MPPNDINIPMAEAHIFTNENKSRWYLEDALGCEYREFQSLENLMLYLQDLIEKAEVESQ